MTTVLVMPSRVTPETVVPGLDSAAPYFSRLSARSALYSELHQLLDASPDLLTVADYRALVVDANPRCTDAWYDLGVTLARLKQRKKARSCFVKALRQNKKYAWAYYDLACLDALERKPNAAFRNLARAIAAGLKDIRHIRRDADLRSLRRDARWKAMLATIRHSG